MTQRRLDIATIAARLAAHDPALVTHDAAPRRAAVAIVLREPARPGGGNGSGPAVRPVEALYIRRVEHPTDPWSGHMAFPGGHVDATDDGAVSAAIRETCEEVGVDLTRDGRYLGRLDDVRGRARGRILPMAITPTVFALDRDVSLRLDAREVAAAFWLPLATLAAGSHASTVRYRRPELGEVELPCWRIEGQCIWGLTYLMTCALLDVIGWPVAPPEALAARLRAGAAP